MNSTAKHNQLVIERTFNASLDLIWEVWTKPEHIAQWYGPKGFDTEVTQMEFKPGGKWKYLMKSPDGRQMPITGVFVEIEKTRRIVSHDDLWKPGDNGGSLDVLISTVTFEELGEQTKVTMILKFPSEQDCKVYVDSGAAWGWNSSFERIDELLLTIQ